MTTKTTYTPTPWRIEHDCGLLEIRGEGQVTELPMCSRGQADAELICRAVNAHFNLLDQLKKATHQLRMRKERTAAENEVIATADKAIAKAEARP
jgi:hypothetical protein